jgi:excisionase family DNA binding protein
MKAQRITNPQAIKRLYSVKEASVYLGRSVWAVREMLWAGKMPHLKDGRRILVDLRDMDAWIDKSKVVTEF